MEYDNKYIGRALQLAEKGAGFTAPNPLVGAVLVYKDRIIGEGYHQEYGQAHAEVNAINSVKKEDRPLISKSIFYVTLEPCSHEGKTPPCADLIIKNKIPKVCIGAMDPNPKVAGRGIQKLKEAGIEVLTGIEKQKCLKLNKRFFTFLQKRRPYLILKWAQSKDGFMALPGPQPVKISQPITNRVVHRWRSEEQGILIGANTAKIDNPQLNNRLWSGKSPTRIVLDRTQSLPESLKLLQDEYPTLIYNRKNNLKKGNKEWIKMADADFLNAVLQDLSQRKFLSVLIEGGFEILQSFLSQNLWDEIRIIEGDIYLNHGLPAPKIYQKPEKIDFLEQDQISYFYAKG